ncbi:hypothetical protein K3217_30950, partial [bacterium BD-1]|nr:hypothetical protein [Ottowia caeni]
GVEQGRLPGFLTSHHRCDFRWIDGKSVDQLQEADSTEFFNGIDQKRTFGHKCARSDFRARHCGSLFAGSDRSKVELREGFVPRAWVVVRVDALRRRHRRSVQAGQNISIRSHLRGGFVLPVSLEAGYSFEILEHEQRKSLEYEPDHCFCCINHCGWDLLADCLSEQKDGQ